MLYSIDYSVVCEDENQAVAVKSQLQQLARPMYSNPPIHGALVVSIILGDPDLKKLWLKEVKVIMIDSRYPYIYALRRLRTFSVFYFDFVIKIKLECIYLYVNLR